MTSAALAFAVALLGWAPLALVFAWRLRCAEKDIAMLLRNASHQSRDIGTVLVVTGDLRVANDRLRDDLADLHATVAELSANERTNALDICRIGDAHVETRGEVIAHARALDAHDERLQALEGR